ncbi:hypothetical protein [Asticcacaulis sp.]
MKDQIIGYIKANPKKALTLALGVAAALGWKAPQAAQDLIAVLPF